MWKFNTVNRIYRISVVAIVLSYVLRPIFYVLYSASFGFSWNSERIAFVYTSSSAMKAFVEFALHTVENTKWQNTTVRVLFRRPGEKFWHDPLEVLLYLKKMGWKLGKEEDRTLIILTTITIGKLRFPRCSKDHQSSLATLEIVDISDSNQRCRIARIQKPIQT